MNELQSTVVYLGNKLTQWNRSFEDAKAFNNKNGHLNAEFSTPLYIWLKNNRTRKKKNTLSQEQIDRLDAIGMVWLPMADKWNVHFQNAKLIYLVNGHLNAKPDSVLYKWLNQNRKSNTNNTITKERKAKLDSIGIDWNPKETKLDKKLLIAQEIYNRKCKLS